MQSKTPTYRKVLYWLCWAILAGLVLFGIYNIFVKG